jgi:uncharacterized protein with HEPN domain
MKEKSLKYLSDVKIAINLIEEFTYGISDFNVFEKDLKTQSAVERQLGIIGEAINQFKKLEPHIQVNNDKQIVAFRNRIVHAYDSLDNSIVWAILINHIRPLKLEIAMIIERESD